MQFDPIANRPARCVSSSAFHATFRHLVFAWMILAASGPSQAVLLDGPDGSRNTMPPTDDPGIGYVGTIGAESAVYLGNGWVLTANHIGDGPLTLAGTSYRRIPGTRRQLVTPGIGPADLAILKYDPDPGLPAIKIGSTTPSNGSLVVMYGHGKNRGAATSWVDDDAVSHDGWQVGAGNTFRWGTNRITAALSSPPLPLDTRSYYTTFDDAGGTSDECQAVPGDSGGAVFLKRFGTWELSGIMFATSIFLGQPDGLALYGNHTFIADLSVYRAEILGVINTPTCSDGFDDDGDGLTDYPADPGCSSADDDDERDAGLVCDNGLDEDGDGLFDWPADPGCDDSLDTSEQSSALLCDDGLDNEGDGFTDFPADPECASPTSPNEGPSPYVPVTSALGSGLLMLLVGAIGGHRSPR